ncbi:MAG: hypothetical protein ACRD0W_08310 [Acidimicrobiales bacterium]
MTASWRSAPRAGTSARSDRCSVRYQDPDGFEGEINCFNPAFEAPTPGAHDDVVDSGWHERAKRLLQAGVVSDADAD